MSTYSNNNLAMNSYSSTFLLHKQQADYHCHRPTPWMQESVSMHKSTTPVRHSRMNQARSEEEEKKRKRDTKDRGQEADGKKGKTKPIKRN